MKLGTKEHYEILEHFEKTYSGHCFNKEKEKKTKILGYIYENGETNKLYQAYIAGYSLGKCVYNELVEEAK